MPQKKTEVTYKLKGILVLPWSIKHHKLDIIYVFLHSDKLISIKLVGPFNNLFNLFCKIYNIF